MIAGTIITIEMMRNIMPRIPVIKVSLSISHLYLIFYKFQKPL